MATSSGKVIYDRDEWNLIVEFAGCSLDESPGSNWVQEGGGLPEYICRIARAIKRSGKTTGQAIAIAVSRVKKWAAGADDVDADTRAKAAKALAEWEKLKAKSKAKGGKKKDHALAASRGQGDILCLTTTFNVDTVRRAWSKQTTDWRSKWSAMNPNASYSDGVPYTYIREMWTTYLIVEAEGSDAIFKVDYEVGDDGTVTFGDPKPVRTEYVVVDEEQTYGTQPTNSELRSLMATAGPCHPSKTQEVLMALTHAPSALDQVLNTSLTRRTALEEVVAAPVLSTSALDQVLRHTGG